MNLERILTTCTAPVLAGALLYSSARAQDVPPSYYTEAPAVSESDSAFSSAMEGSELADAYTLALMVRAKIGSEPTLNDRQRDYVRKYITEKKIPCTANTASVKGLKSLDFIRAPAGSPVPYLVRLHATEGGEVCFKPGQFMDMVRGIAKREKSQ